MPSRLCRSLPCEPLHDSFADCLEIVDTQLRDGTPPETRQTFERLVVGGYTPEGARQLLAHVVHEIFSVMARDEHYDQRRFVAAL